MKQNKYFKGPSIDTIKKRVSLLPLEERFRIAIKNNCIWLVKQCLDDGVDPSFDNNWAIWWAVYNDYKEITSLLFVYPRVNHPLYNHKRRSDRNLEKEIDTIDELLKDKRVIKRLDNRVPNMN